MIKMIASDLDGTLLLDKAQSLPPELFPIIRKLKEQGILFVAASGRQYANMKRLFAPVAGDIAFICENGALAIQNEQVLYQTDFALGLVKEIIQTIMETDECEFTCSTKDFYYFMPKTEAFYNLMVHEIGNVGKVIESVDEIAEPCMKVAVYNKNGINEEFIRFWQERFSKRCKVVTSGNDWLDFVPYETNKANGIKTFQKKLGVTPEECVVFGDEYNDIEMLECVPNSFAMSHSKAGVKLHAVYQAVRVEPILEKIIDAKGNFEEVLKCIQKNV